jgi:hypothetical protein
MNVNEIDNKPKLKRGRPKKNSNLIENVNKTSGIYQVGQIIRKSCTFVKQYIVSLNISIDDLSGNSQSSSLPLPLSLSLSLSKQKINIPTYESILDDLNYSNINNEKLYIPNFYPTKVINLNPEIIPINIINKPNISNLVNLNIPQSNSVNLNGTQSNSVNSTKPNNDLLILCPLLKNKYGNDWPDKSSYLCWNCDMSFNTCPIGIPDKEYMGKYYCYGNFCSFQCSARYIYDKESHTDYIKKYSMLCTLYQTVNNLTADNKIIMAPSRELREKYGGNISDEKYREIINSSNDEIKYEIYKLPLVPTYLHISQIYNNIGNLNKLNTKEQIKEVSKEKKYIPLDKDDLRKSQDNVKKFLVGTLIN